MGFANTDEQGLKPEEDYRKNNLNSLIFCIVSGLTMYFYSTCISLLHRNNVKLASRETKWLHVKLVTDLFGS